MDQLLENITKLNTNYLIYIAIAVAALIILIIIYKNIKLKSYKKKITDVQVQLQAIKSLPLQYRLGRVHSISKNMPEIVPKYQEFSKEYERIQTFLKNELLIELNEADEMLFYNKTKGIKKKIAGVFELLDTYEKDCKKLLIEMEEITEVENIQRVQIIKIKEIYRACIDKFERMRYKVEDNVPAFSSHFNKTDEWFVQLEDLMNNQKFDEAADFTEQIRVEVEWIENILKDLLNYAVLVNNVIPSHIDELHDLIDRMRKDNYALDKLDCDTRMKSIETELEECAKILKSLDFKDLDVKFKELLDVVEGLKNDLNTEISSYHQFKGVWKNCYNYVVQTYTDYKMCMNAYEKMKTLFVLDSYSIDIQEHFNEFEVLVAKTKDVEDEIKRGNFSYTATLNKISDIRLQTNEHAPFIKEFNNQKEEIYIAKQRADDGLDTINILLLEIKSQIKNKHLPNIDESYKDFISDAKKLAVEIQEYKSKKPIDLNELTKKVDEARDIVVKLYKNVSNLITTVDMIEEAIVFGNRYRYEFLEVNTELTKAELLYRNGEYTKALTTAVEIIEKMKPGSFEQLIKRNEKMN